MESIATLNHFAVTCMDANKLKEAIHVLVQALEITIRQFYHIHHGSPNDLEGGPTLSPSRLSSCNEGASPPPAELTTMVATTIANNGIQHRDVAQQPFNCSSSRKYEQPFLVLQQEMDCRTTSSWSTTTFLSMIVIFNCALCHDSLASSSTTVSTTRRQVLRYKAISLYEKVVNLYIELSNDSFKEQEDSTGFHGTLGAQQDMIVMAAVNNLVQLHHESSAIRNHYVQLMMALFQQVQTTDYGCDQIRSQVNSQGRVFVSNTLLCRAMELTCAIAPAA
jgi:hypothetical protein